MQAMKPTDFGLWYEFSTNSEFNFLTSRHLDLFNLPVVT